jgi:hypothetical protein
MSFQYTSVNDASLTVYAGPNLTGTVLATLALPAVGVCPGQCGDPTGNFGIWRNVTVPLLSGGGVIAGSAGFSSSINTTFVLVDDMVLELAPPPTVRPTKAPTLSPALACRKGRKGATMKRCRKKAP